MRSSTVLVLVAACLALTQGAIAATPPASAPKAAPTKAPAKPATAESPETTAKRAACEQTWRAQTKHTGKHKAFIAACVAKG